MRHALLLPFQNSVTCGPALSASRSP
jgi:hypothetical protein